MSERKGIAVEITDAREFHCFRLQFRPKNSPQPIEIMLHATALVDLIHEASTALCEWQRATSEALILAKTGYTREEARAMGLIA